MERTLIPLCALPASPAPGWLPRLGDALRRHRGTIAAVQWAVVVFYLVLVAVSAFLPLPGDLARIHNDLTLLAQFIFWGIWWPFVILGTMGLGRVWCGLFCPEGTLTEAVSRHGLGRPVPRWLKWGGWPFVAFILTTVYGQLVSVYEYPKAALLVLGGSTVAALAVGFLYGKGKRVWCRHLCPVSGVFALLARLSPLHYRVDRAAWDAAGRQGGVDCAPLLDMRRMKGSAQCHMCGRCSGHRDAVFLAARAPGSEITHPAAELRPWDARLLVFGLIGVAAGAFQWSSSPWFVAVKLRLAEWLVERDSYLLLQDNAPWWLLTHYPTANDVFTWLDGLMIVGYIGTAALLLGLWATVWLALAARLAGRADASARHRLALCLTPLGGFGVFLGLSALTVTLLGSEGIAVPNLAYLRGTLLATAVLWSLVLAARLLPRLGTVSRPRLGAAWLALAIAAVGLTWPWVQLFFIW